MAAHYFLGRCGRAEVTGKSHDIAAGCGRDAGNRPVHASFGATGNNDMCAFPGQACGDRETDSRGAPGDQGAPAFEMKVHACSFD
jgi:hypothetical protein